MALDSAPVYVFWDLEREPLHDVGLWYLVFVNVDVFLLFSKNVLMYI